MSFSQSLVQASAGEAAQPWKVKALAGRDGPTMGSLEMRDLRGTDEEESGGRLGEGGCLWLGRRTVFALPNFGRLASRFLHYGEHCPFPALRGDIPLSLGRER